MRQLAIISTVVILLLFPIPIATSSSYTNIAVIEAHTLIESNPTLVILDVRTQSEYDSGHIRLAIHIPVDELEGRLDELNTTDEILVYCKAGGRSASASQVLVDNGFLNIFNMLGGIDEWKSQEYPVYIKYASLQSAINQATPGDSLYVSSGIYNEHLLVNKSVSIIGEYVNNTIINGQGENQTIVEFTANNIIFKGFTVRNTSRFAGTSYAAIRVSGHTCTIIANHVTEAQLGMLIGLSQNTVITNNIATNNGHGIALYGTTNTTIVANYFYNNVVGISLATSHNIIIEDNTANNSSIGGHGITLLSNSYGNIIRRNEMRFNYHGIWLSNSTSNEIYENIIADNALLGIELANSNGNIFFKNNVVDNPRSVVIDLSSISLWNNSCEGNYWSDYNGYDSDGNGIGDIPYSINADNQDNYPLMNPYWSPADVNYDLEIDIYDVVLACLAYNSTTSDPRWNCHCDIAEPYGKIDIFDIVMICTSYGETYTP